jgi:hypothetical protein
LNLSAFLLEVFFPAYHLDDGFVFIDNPSLANHLRCFFWGQQGDLQFHGKEFIYADILKSLVVGGGGNDEQMASGVGWDASDESR